MLIRQGDQKSMDMEAEAVIGDRGQFPTQSDIKKSVSNAYLRLVASDFQFGDDGTKRQKETDRQTRTTRNGQLERNRSRKK